MANNSIKISELPIANILDANDRILALTNVNSTPNTKSVSVTCFHDKVQSSVNSDSRSLLLEDRVKHLFITVNTSISIPTNDSTAFPVGSNILVITDEGMVANIVASNSSITRIVGSNLTYTSNGYHIAEKSAVNVIKIGTDKWFIYGNGLTGL